MITVTDQLPRTGGNYLLKPLSTAEAVRLVDADNGGQCRFALSDAALAQILTRTFGQRAHLGTWQGNNQEREEIIFAQIVGDKLRFTLLSCFYAGTDPLGRKL